jgi:hypothetical protein
MLYGGKIWGILIAGLIFAQLGRAESVVTKPSHDEVFKKGLKDLVFVLNSQKTLVEQAYYLDLQSESPSLMNTISSEADTADFNDRNLVHPIRIKWINPMTLVFSSSDFEPIAFSYLNIPSPNKVFSLKVGARSLTLHLDGSGEIADQDSAALDRAISEQIKFTKSFNQRKKKSTAAFLLQQLLGPVCAAEEGGGWGAAIAKVLGKFVSTSADVIRQLDDICTSINLARNQCDESLATMQTYTQGFWAGTNTDKLKTGEFVMLANRIGLNFNKIAGGMIQSLQLAGFCAIAKTQFAQDAGKATLQWAEPRVNAALEKVKIDPNVFTILCRKNLQKLDDCMDIIFTKGAKRFNAKAEVIVRDPSCPVLNYYSAELPDQDNVFPEDDEQEKNTGEMAKKFIRITKLQSMLLNNNLQPGQAAPGN